MFRSLLRAGLLAAVPAFLVVPPVAAAIVATGIYRHGWIGYGFWHLSLSHGVRIVAASAWIAWLLVLGVLASSHAASARSVSLAERVAAAAASWALLLYPLYLLLTPQLRAMLMQHEQGSTVLLALIAIPQTLIGASALWAIALYALWRWKKWQNRGQAPISGEGASAPPHGENRGQAPIFDNPGQARFFERIRTCPRFLGRWAVAAGVALAVAAVAVDAAAPAPPAGSPNIVWIIVDTLRADHLGAYGYTRHPTSPHLDAFAKDAVVYEHAVTPAPWTSPAVAAMLTARQPRRLGFQQVPVVLEPREVSLVEILRAKGFRTDAVVSNMFASSALGFDSGFETMDESEISGHLRVSSSGVTERAMRIAEQRAGEPFFLWVHYFDPHFAYRMHDDFEFDPGYRGELRGGLTHAEFTVRLPKMSRGEVDYVAAAYDSEIAYTDAHVGRLLDRLKALDLYDDSLIVFTSDHGEELAERGDHFIGHGRTVYEELLHVPLIVKWPKGRGAGTRVARTVTIMDIAPSVLAAAGAAFPPGIELDGERLDGAPLGNDGQGRIVVAETRRDVDKRAVYDGTWKLVADRASGRSHLFDLASDPGERSDVASDHADVQQRLLGSVDDWERRLGDPSAAVASFGARDTERLRAIGYVQ